MPPVGRVQRIYRYPVKSMAAESLSGASLGWNGLEGDRRFAFRRAGSTSGFPWLTGRNLPRLITYRPHFAETESSSRDNLRVLTPEGDDLGISSDDLHDNIASAHGADVELTHIERGIFDEAHVSIISTRSIAALELDVTRSLDERRFRPNLVVETFDSAAYAEETWVGRILTFGQGVDAPAVSVTHRDKRCVMINLDPDTAEADARVLKTVVRTRDKCTGVYGAVVRTGVIEEGDLIFCGDQGNRLSDTNRTS